MSQSVDKLNTYVVVFKWLKQHSSNSGLLLNLKFNSQQCENFSCRLFTELPGYLVHVNQIMEFVNSFVQSFSVQFLICLANYPPAILILLVQIGLFGLNQRVEALIIKLVFAFCTFFAKCYKCKVFPDLFQLIIIQLCRCILIL